MRSRWENLPVYLCGFSAGGHLACSLGVHWPEFNVPRPNGLILSYPVISAGEYAHRGSIENLAGGRDADYFSLEKHAGKHVPPTFLWATAEDATVPVENTLMFAYALMKAGVPVEMHIYPFGPHGLSLATAETQRPENKVYADPHVATWSDLCVDWLDMLERKNIF
ncbi:MAG: alpha/beta hydrolase [Clostridia bacterium]|nr:alpha/beta hydrolase [Clostridia bacterium]